MLKYVITPQTPKSFFKKFIFFSTTYKNEWKEHKFWWEKRSTKVIFIKTKNYINIYDTNVNKILIPKKEPYGKKSSFKYFLGYNDDDDVIRPLCRKLSQMIGYVKWFDTNKTIPCKVNENSLLKKYNKIPENVSSLVDIELDSEPVYGDNDKYIKTKTKSFGDKVNTNFQGKKISKKWITQLFIISNAKFCY